jgi:acyl-CoA synthetase (AMP-forming)/AMP-acid ligase II
MAGYLPEGDTAAAFADGWYRTGDVGWVEPEGWVHLTDRAKEMIKVNGFQVAPAEIEAVLHGHLGVRDCAVFGVPDDAAGERPEIPRLPSGKVLRRVLQQDWLMDGHDDVRRT